jgi:hypothetical protein
MVMSPVPAPMMSPVVSFAVLLGLNHLRMRPNWAVVHGGRCGTQ